MIDPVYILIRTSRRPEFFKRCFESIKNQTYKNIVTIVHTDDPRDKYIQGDIIIKGQAFGLNYGSATYNFYNNTLLKSIPDVSGWFYFMDDDDELFDSTVIEKFVNAAKRDCINVARVIRWNNKIFPEKWGVQKSYQTECFITHTDHKNKARWWGNKGGDHFYSKQLTRILPINWIENLIVCKAQEGKGHGKRLDSGGVKNTDSDIKPNEKIHVLGLVPYKHGTRKEWIRQGEIKLINFELAQELDKKGVAKITHYV
jgi:glycosyltransferase involved in cell wall biosynthesis